jgi:hypothetical protein
MSSFRVSLRRRGVSPLSLTMVVNAATREEAAGIAVAVAEHERGGMFEAGRVRSLGRGAAGVTADA